MCAFKFIIYINIGNARKRYNLIHKTEGVVNYSSNIGAIDRGHRPDRR